MFQGLQDVPIGLFDSEQNQWMLTRGDRSHTERRELTFVTYNIWFGEYHVRQRYEAIFQILENSQADLITLQEVTEFSLTLLLQQPWVRRNYVCSDISGKTFSRYGVIVLSRIPLTRIRIQPLPSFMGRKLVVAEALINHETWKIGTVHLESQKQSKPIRRQQLNVIFRLLSRSQHSILMGDFNFCSSWQDENDCLPQAYVDVWSNLYPTQAGYTEDTAINRKP